MKKQCDHNHLSPNISTRSSIQPSIPQLKPYTTHVTLHACLKFDPNGIEPEKKKKKKKKCSSVQRSKHREENLTNTTPKLYLKINQPSLTILNMYGFAGCNMPTSIAGLKRATGDDRS